MRKKDTLDVMASAVAVCSDAVTVFGGFMLATWLRFDTGWFPIPHGRPVNLYASYARGAAVAALLFLFVFRSLGLYVRPQLGRFESKIPKLVRATALSLILSMVLAYLVKNYYVEFSGLTFLLSFATIAFFVVLERYILFRLELHYARHSPVVNRVLILGTDEVAAHLKRSLAREPKLRSDVIGFLRTEASPVHEAVPHDLVRGDVGDLATIAGAGKVDQVILTNSALGHQRIVDILLFCERNVIRFNMVPDLFRILTGSMDVQAIDDIPLLGVSRWPLDLFWNRVLKRAEDIAGALLGLVVSLPVIMIAAVAIKRASPGPVFYRQERCGEDGRPFILYKLRTMRQDAEAETGPVFTAQNDPRATGVGMFLRRHNLDELPQLWNVLKGDMSLVGPRPERPHFVEKFKADISRYMWRHVSKPGMTGWAQVNGLRGNTSIEERIRYDLYYLENWSLAFDFKILARSIFAHDNAY